MDNSNLILIMLLYLFIYFCFSPAVIFYCHLLTIPYEYLLDLQSHVFIQLIQESDINGTNQYITRRDQNIAYSEIQLFHQSLGLAPEKINSE